MPTLLKSAQDAGKRVIVCPIHEYWIDVGRPETLVEAHSTWSNIAGAISFSILHLLFHSIVIIILTHAFAHDLFRLALSPPLSLDYSDVRLITTATFYSGFSNPCKKSC